VTQQYSQEEISTVYRRECLLYHPDHNPSPSAHRHFKTLQEAYSILKDPEIRAQYDRWLHSQLDVPFEVWRQSQTVAHWTEPGAQVTTTHTEREEARRKFRSYQL
jgi:DnaJ-class molecular chaperone